MQANCKLTSKSKAKRRLNFCDGYSKRRKRKVVSPVVKVEKSFKENESMAQTTHAVEKKTKASSLKQQVFVEKKCFN